MSRRFLIGLVVLLMLGGGFFWRGYGVGGQTGNRLGDEISPYLLLHAHNPVDWYPWGEEALTRSRQEQKPIFLSIGYATCYWCHVMERNVFSDPEIAALMNEHFINIKVDREERPDLDDLYMTATQLMTGSGGWPNSVFLTPELKPYYAGTYFPPEDLPGRPGFPGVVFGMSQTWQNERARVEAYADRVTEAIRAIKSEAFVPDDSVAIDHELVAQAVAQLTSRYDSQNAGFGGAPKFPQAMQLELLLRFYERNPDPRILEIITHTLDTMANGGIYDHLGGGFHRYATDARWRVPHFEKMLYNQGDLSRLYLKAYEVTGNERYRRVGRRILDFVARDMLGPDGAFYSAIDSETDAIEGFYYLWTESEIRETLGTDTDLFYWVYGLTPMPEGEGQVLYKISSADSAAAKVGMGIDEFRHRLDELEARLLRRRMHRKSPLVDTKVVTAWNGLMVDAYAFAYNVTGERRYLEIATGAADFLLAELRTDSGDLMRTFRDGTVKYRAYQEDYAYLARGLMRLHEVTGAARWLDAAVDLTDRMVTGFWDARRGGFHFTDGADSLIVRTKNPFDAAMASGNAVAAHVLVGLARDTGSQAYHDRAQSLFETFAHEIKADPGRFTHQVAALDDYLHADWAEILSALPADDGILLGKARMAPALSFQPLNLAGPTGGSPVVHGSLDITSVLPGPGQTFEAVVRLDIEDGWHINAVPTSGKELIPTTVVFNSDDPLEVISVDYPDGQDMEFAFADESLSVYSGELVVFAVIRFTEPPISDHSSVLRAVVSFQACSDVVCLAPRELILSVPIPD